LNFVHHARIEDATPNSRSTSSTTSYSKKAHLLSFVLLAPQLAREPDPAGIAAHHIDMGRHIRLVEPVDYMASRGINQTDGMSIQLPHKRLPLRPPGQAAPSTFACATARL
jgi:hypothetical protein